MGPFIVQQLSVLVSLRRYLKLDSIAGQLDCRRGVSCRNSRQRRRRLAGQRRVLRVARHRPRLVLLSELVRAGARAERDLGLVPVTVVFQRVKDLLGVRVNKIRPSFPKRVDDVVDKTDLHLMRIINLSAVHIKNSYQFKGP